MLDLLDPKSGQHRGQAEEEARARKITEYVRQVQHLPAPKVERVCGKFVEGRIEGQWTGGWPSVAQFGQALQKESAEPGDYDGWTSTAIENKTPQQEYHRPPELETKHEEWRRIGREYINGIMKDWDEEHKWHTTTDKAVKAKLLQLRMVEFRKRTGVGEW